MPLVLGLDVGVGSLGWALIRTRPDGTTAGKPHKLVRIGARTFDSGVEGDMAKGKESSLAAARREARMIRRQLRRRRERLRKLLIALQAVGLLPPGASESGASQHDYFLKIDNDLRATWERPGTTTHKERQLLPYRLRAAAIERPLTAIEVGRALFHLAQRRGFQSNRIENIDDDATDSPAAIAGNAGAAIAITSSAGSPTPPAGDTPTEGKSKAAKAPRKAKGKPLGTDDADDASDDSETGEGNAASAAEKAKQREKELGIVKQGIHDLKAAMAEMEKATGVAPTLASYLLTQDPVRLPADGGGQRIRKRYTQRDMLKHEFERIWEAQAKHHANMTPEAKNAIFRAIFFQRGLRSAKSLVGTCELNPNQRRCPIALPIAQRFRMVQRVNDLKVILPAKPFGTTERPLAPSERETLLAALSNQGEMTFGAVRKLLGFPKDSKFNLENGGETKLLGDRTTSKLRSILGGSWDRSAPEKQRAMLLDLMHYQKPAALLKRALEAYDLAPDVARKFARLTLEPGYASHSHQTLARLVPMMEAGETGTSYATARKVLQEQLLAEGAIKAPAPSGTIPPVANVLKHTGSPAVTRSLGEIRTIINTLVRRYGVPDVVRVELGRDLKKGKTQREKDASVMRAREKERIWASDKALTAELLKEKGITKPHKADVDRVLLANECGDMCAYCGKSFGINDLIGRNRSFDVEHIWPMSRSLDDSFANKTIACADCNDLKGNRTPFEAFERGGRWHEILERVSRFKGGMAREKLRRFQAEDIPDGFAARHLVETRVLAVRTTELLGSLHGCTNGVDASGTRRVTVVAGGLTAHLRREWHLNGILSPRRADGLTDEQLDIKNRKDHRHHAIDAVVIALTDQAVVNALQNAAKNASIAKRRMFAPVETPWPTFGLDVQRAVEKMVVSHRLSKRMRGSLHAGTNYSKEIKPKDANGNVIESAKGVHRVRRPLVALKASEIENIADEAVKAVVIAAIQRAGGEEPKKVFAHAANLPRVRDKFGNEHVIHKVRINANKVSTFPMGEGERRRLVESTQGSNHHAEVWKGVDGKGRLTVQLVIVPLRDVKRHSAKQPTPPKLGMKLAYTLCAGEHLEVERDGTRRFARILGISDGEVTCVAHWDGRTQKELVKGKGQIRLSPSSLTGEGVNKVLRKVLVTPLGNVLPAND